MERGTHNDLLEHRGVYAQLHKCNSANDRAHLVRESPLWRLLLPLSWLYGLVSGVIRLCYQTGVAKLARAGAGGGGW